jgi:hypothetical protein
MESLFLPMAFISEDMMGMLIGVLFMMIPIIWILTKHQQRMTTLLRADQGNQPLPNPEVHHLRIEVQQLRDLVAQQTVMIDNLVSSQSDLVKSLQERGDLRTRLVADERAV